MIEIEGYPSAVPVFFIDLGKSKLNRVDTNVAC